MVRNVIVKSQYANIISGFDMKSRVPNIEENYFRSFPSCIKAGISTNSAEDQLESSGEVKNSSKMYVEQMKNVFSRKKSVNMTQEVQKRFSMYFVQ